MILTFFRQKDTTLEFTVGSEVDVTLSVLFNVIPNLNVMFNVIPINHHLPCYMPSRIITFNVIFNPSFGIPLFKKKNPYMSA